MMKKIYPRTGDKQAVYLNAVVKDPSIEVGDYTIYNDFVSDPAAFRAPQCTLSLSYQPRAVDNRKVLFHCLRNEVFVQLCQSYLAVFIYLYIPVILRGLGFEESRCGKGLGQ